MKGPKYEIYHEKDLGGLLLQFALVCFWVRMKAKNEMKRYNSVVGGLPMTTSQPSDLINNTFSLFSRWQENAEPDLYLGFCLHAVPDPVRKNFHLFAVLLIRDVFQERVALFRKTFSADAY